MEFDFVSLADFLEELAERRGEELQAAATYLAGRLRASPSHEWLIDNPSAPYIKPASPEERRRLNRLLRYVAEHGHLEHPDTRPPLPTGATTYDRMYRAASPAEISPDPDRLYSIGGFHREEVEQIVGKDAVRAPEKAEAPRLGLSKREILAVTWPLPHGRNLEPLLSDVPKWLVPALTNRGSQGKGSSTWNPAAIADCLASKTHHKTWVINFGTLDFFIRKYFPAWIPEWERLSQYGAVNAALTTGNKYGTTAVNPRRY